MCLMPQPFTILVLAIFVIGLAYSPLCYFGSTGGSFIGPLNSKPYLEADVLHPVTKVRERVIFLTAADKEAYVFRLNLQVIALKTPFPYSIAVVLLSASIQGLITLALDRGRRSVIKLIFANKRIFISLCGTFVALVLAGEFDVVSEFYSKFFPFSGNNVFHVDHIGHQDLRVKIGRYTELLKNPYFKDRVKRRPSLEEVINAQEMTRNNLSVKQKSFLHRLDVYLEAATQDPINLQILSEHKVCLHDPDYPGHEGHPQHQDWVKKVNLNLIQGKI